MMLWTSDKCFLLIILLCILTFTTSIVSTFDIKVIVNKSHKNGSVLHLDAHEFSKQALNSELTKERRNAVKKWNYLWDRGIVYFDFDSAATDFKLLIVLNEAIKEFHTKTCIRWQRRKLTDVHITDYVTFTMPRSGVQLCKTPVGKQTGKQYLILDEQCSKARKEVLRQMMHALGFYDMHIRPDRDQYVKIHPENIEPAFIGYFEKKTSADMTTTDFPYDYHSIMQIATDAYSVNGKATITSINPQVKLGDSESLTELDIKLIQTTYSGCKESCRFGNGGCSHLCSENSAGVLKCSCFQGFRLSPDGKSCYDFDECSVNNGGCAHRCIRHGPWYRCECTTGYKLLDDFHSCDLDAVVG